MSKTVGRINKTEYTDNEYYQSREFVEKKKHKHEKKQWFQLKNMRNCSLNDLPIADDENDEDL